MLGASLFGCLGLVWFVAGVGAVVYGFGRLFLAPYIAATQPLDTRSAILASWHLTRGYWWHAVTPVLAVGLVVLLLSTPVANVELISYALEMLFAQPLVSAILQPLLSLAVMAVLYDLRLRRQGPDAVLHKPST